MFLFGIGVIYLILHFAVGSAYAQELKQEVS
jgi:hypothetical protein